MTTKIKLILLLLCLPFVCQAQLYKCKRPDGTTTFQDVACPSGALTTKMAAPPSGNAATMSLNADSNGHYHSTFAINGVTDQGIIDTGASMVTISSKTATSMGINTAGMDPVNFRTANGAIRAYCKSFPMVKIGNIDIYGVEVCVADNAGANMIGMSALSHFKINQEMGKMTLTKQ